MRKQLYVSIGSREVWRDAEQAAEADSISLSDFTAAALRAHLANRARRLARQSEAAK